MENLKLLPPKEQEYMEMLFRDCTDEIRDSIVTQKVEKGHNFIIAGETCRNVFILLKGSAKGIDMQIQGQIYIFKEFGPGSILGEFECMSDILEYGITIQAMTECILWKMPAAMYRQWMKKDGNAVFLRMQRLMSELTYQTRESRRYMLLNCNDRLTLYLINRYEKQKEKSSMTVRKSREELAETIGTCSKTINRNVKKLQAEGFISLCGGKITVSDVQYHTMKKYVLEKLF